MFIFNAYQEHKSKLFIVHLFQNKSGLLRIKIINLRG